MQNDYLCLCFRLVVLVCILYLELLFSNFNSYWRIKVKVDGPVYQLKIKYKVRN